MTCPFEVRVRIIFPGPVVLVLACGRVRGEFFQPHVVIVQKPFLGIVDEDRGCDVHRGY
jgi:hypothetical protein